jgi:hypothetical protein
VESESPPCGDELGGEVTGQGHPPGCNDWGGQPYGSFYSHYPHGRILMWTGMGGILAIQKCLLFFNLGIGLDQNNEL